MGTHLPERLRLLLLFVEFLVTDVPLFEKNEGIEDCVAEKEVDGEEVKVEEEVSDVEVAI